MEDVVSGICQDILHQAMKTFQQYGHKIKDGKLFIVCVLCT